MKSLPRTGEKGSSGQSIANGETYRFRSRFDAEFAVDALEVGADGSDGHVGLARDILVRTPLPHEGEDLQFLAGQVGTSRRRGAQFGKGEQSPANSPERLICTAFSLVTASRAAAKDISRAA
jgi:hypothetical protein